MRIDYHSHVGTEWVLQGGLAFHLPGNAEMKMMVSKGFRNPHYMRNVYVLPSQSGIVCPGGKLVGTTL